MHSPAQYLRDFDARLAVCEEDLFGTVTSYWSLACLYESLEKERQAAASDATQISLATALTSLQHSTIIGVCRLDDDESLRYAAKALQKHDGKNYSEITRQLKTFRRIINPIKDQHRKNYIAHTKKDLDFDNIPSIPSLLPFVEAAVTVFTAVAQRPPNLVLRTVNGFQFDLGTWLSKCSKQNNI
jgi:hypothetical protein